MKGGELSLIMENVARAREKIAAAVASAGREPGEVALVAITKQRTRDEALAAVAAGADAIGESRLQEAAAKFGGITRNFELRMVGHLQGNKAAKAVEVFDSVDSVDSIRLAAKLAGAERVVPALVEVNISGEESKSGFAPASLDEVVAEIAGMKKIRLDGLMTIGPLTDDEKDIRKAFKRMKDMFDALAGRHGFSVLSMGMSDDFEIAIQEGATMVRIGRALFERGWF